MNNYIVFDCYQTLIYKKDLEEIVQSFLTRELKIKIPVCFIKQAYDLIYYKYKFNHPRFKDAENRRKYYINYNKELLGILGFEISTDQALLLNDYFSKSKYETYTDVIPTLDYLKKNKLPMGIISNWTATLEKVLEGLKLDKYFDVIDSSHYLKIQKPDPKIFTKALAKKIREYNKIYYIGDDYQLDIVPARVAGLSPILIDRDGKYPAKIDCKKIKSLNKLKDIA